MKEKTALVFSGQGSAFENMCKSFYEHMQTCEHLGKLANETYSKCTTLQASELNKTINCQPATFLLSAMGFEAMKSIDFKFDGVCGFSLGEVSALYASGVFNFESALKVIKQRAESMQKAADNSNGGMFAILGLDRDKINEICKASSGYVIPVNFNSPVQTVIAGEYPFLDEVANECLNQGAKRAVKLAVNAGFHSKLMEGASEEFYNAIKNVETSNFNCEFYSTVTADKIEKIDDVSEYLKIQMTSPVEFTKVITKMVSDGYTTFIELGAGSVLSGLIKKIDRNVKAISISDYEGFENFKQSLNS